MKVVLVGNTDPTEFQNSINNFIADKHVIDIKYTSTLVHVDGGTAIADRALIMYEEFVPVGYKMSTNEEEQSNDS